LKSHAKVDACTGSSWDQPRGWELGHSTSSKGGLYHLRQGTCPKSRIDGGQQGGKNGAGQGPAKLRPAEAKSLGKESTARQNPSLYSEAENVTHPCVPRTGSGARPTMPAHNLLAGITVRGRMLRRLAATHA